MRARVRGSICDVLNSRPPHGAGRGLAFVGSTLNVQRGVTPGATGAAVQIDENHAHAFAATWMDA